MQSSPLAREQLQARLFDRYCRYTSSQRQALDEVFSALFRVSFAKCFYPSRNNQMVDEAEKSYMPTELLNGH